MPTASATASNLEPEIDQLETIEAEQQAAGLVGLPSPEGQYVILRCWSGLRHGPYA